VWPYIAADLDKLTREILFYTKHYDKTIIPFINAGALSSDRIGFELETLQKRFPEIKDFFQFKTGEIEKPIPVTDFKSKGIKTFSKNEKGFLERWIENIERNFSIKAFSTSDFSYPNTNKGKHKHLYAFGYCSTCGKAEPRGRKKRSKSLWDIEI